MGEERKESAQESQDKAASESGIPLADVAVMSRANAGFDPSPDEYFKIPGGVERERPSVDEEGKVRLYRRRWYILLVVSFLNISNAMLWICFAPIATTVNVHYDNLDGAADYFSIVFMVVSIPMSFVAMWGVDRFGLRSGVWLGSLANVVGAAVKVVASAPLVPVAARFPIAITGQCIAAAAQPFIMFLPTKLAGKWFPPSQRAIANTLGSMSNPLGIMIAMLSAPAIIKNDSADPDPGYILRLNGVMLGPAILVSVMGFAGVWASNPPTPPTAAVEDVQAFWPSLKACLKNKSFWALLLTLGGGVGLFNAIYTLMQQILCPKGYSQDFAGLSGALLIIGGLVGSAIAGVIVDATKRFQEVAKVCYAVAALVSIPLAILVLMRGMGPGINTLFFFFGFFGFALYPIGLEMGVEVTYPVPEATSSGLIIVSGQVQGIIYTMVMTALGTVEAASAADKKNAVVCDLKPEDVPNWRVPAIMFSVLACVLSTSLIAFFWPVYRRMAAEKDHSAKADEPEPQIVHM